MSEQAHQPAHWASDYTILPLTESVSEEWWHRVPDAVIWVGRVAAAKEHPARWLPNPYAEFTRLDQYVYERLICDDMAVFGVQVDFAGVTSTYITVPFVAVRRRGSEWCCAMSWQALESVEAVVRAYGRPPWMDGVEIQPVWGKGRLGQQCVALRPCTLDSGKESL